MPDVFLSYTREDQATARRFAEAFEREGFKVWWDTTLRAGEAYDQVTEKTLKEAKAVVVLWSKRSVESRWVRAEATVGDRNKTLVPVMIEPCDRPIMFELTHTADLAHWQGAKDDKAWLAFLADVRRFAEKRTAPVPAAQPVKQALAPAKPAILILPFVNMSGDAEQEYFSDGVTEDIITDLGRVAALTVISRNAAFSYKGQTLSPSQLASTLKISHVMEGSVRKSGNRVRITAQLLDAASDTQVWSERFDRTLDDIFAIQEEIARAIVGALKLKLAPAEKKAIEQRPTSNSEAYELYLMARQINRTGSERMRPLIVRLCNRIVELDPNFARAWALMSSAEAEAAHRVVPGFTFARAREAAERAIALDPSVAEGHAALAEVILRSDAMDAEAALREAHEALRLDPNCFEGHLQVGYSSIILRRWDDAIGALEAAVALDENGFRPAGMVVQAYQALGDKENALAASRRSLARCERILAVEPDHGGALGFFVSALADLGEVDRAREWARRSVLFDPDNIRMIYNVACGMAGMKDAETATELLDTVIEKVSLGWLRWIDKDNSLDPIRDDPRFIALNKRIEARLRDEQSSGA